LIVPALETQASETGSKILSGRVFVGALRKSVDIIWNGR
jgi:hypothetical protein